MWKRKTFHECAEELELLSSEFRNAYISKSANRECSRQEILEDTSKRGVEILRILALSIRSEQDYGYIPSVRMTVGALRQTDNGSEVAEVFGSYRPSYNDREDYKPLHLREALNKIAHVNPNQTSFVASETIHELMLSGTHGTKTWIAIVSIPDLCHVIKSLPDQNIHSA